MQWALIDNTQKVINLIVYDGVDAYEPPENLTLIQANDWIDIDDQIDAPQPS